jgi:hypothetical protein
MDWSIGSGGGIRAATNGVERPEQNWEGELRKT